ncbi:HlyD family efflux transporter periplasmic adaptor subunit [Myxacorys almedinensis A]|uniref:HlyD family efflux transporter periplasmic adaptor subunit n=1 Tax=Myxacorys almedinensis A TaxID=2690445 RepID=A0A8J7Z163_9CYAN|nr:HlyD family efflux transporter periplasmic adaptor subunit [Myxacorys almedinensis A]
MKPTSVRLILIGSAISLALAGFGIFSYTIFRPVSQEASSSPSPAVPATPNAISALGRLEPAGGVFKIASPSATLGGGVGGSRVTRLLIKEGARVKADQPLAVIDNYDSLLASAMQAEAQVKEAQAQLAQVEAGAKQGDINAQRASVLRANAELPKAEADFQRADAEYRKAQWEAERYGQLFQSGAISESELRDRTLNLETKEKQRQQVRQAVEQAKLELEGARQTLNSVSEVRPTDVQQAQARVQVAVANFQKARADLNNAIVRAPVEGQVLKIYADPGEVIGNDGILDLGKTSQMYAVAEVDETYIGQVKAGQRAIITSYAFPGEIGGTVERVGLQVSKNAVLSTDPVEKTDTRVVEVKIRLDDSTTTAGLSNLQVKVAINTAGATP